MIYSSAVVSKLIPISAIIFSSLAFSVFGATPQEMYDAQPRNIAMGNFGITWAIPDTRENGDALAVDKIDHYELYITGNTSAGQNVDQLIIIEGGATTTADVPIMGDGSYVFAMAAVDTDGLASKLTDYEPIDVLAKSRPSKMPSFSVDIICEDGAICNFYINQ